MVRKIAIAILITTPLVVDFAARMLPDATPPVEVAAPEATAVAAPKPAPAAQPVVPMTMGQDAANAGAPFDPQPTLDPDAIAAARTPGFAKPPVAPPVPVDQAPATEGDAGTQEQGGEGAPSST